MVDDDMDVDDDEEGDEGEEEEEEREEENIVKNLPKVKPAVAAPPSGFSYAPEHTPDIIYHYPQQNNITMPSIRDVKAIEYDDKYIDVSLPCVDPTHANIPYRFQVGKETVSQLYI